MGTIVDTSKLNTFGKMPSIETLPAEESDKTVGDAIPAEKLQKEEPKESTDSSGACGEPKQSPTSKPPALSNLALLDDDDDDEDDDEDIEDESLVERVCALSEMFPSSIRKSTSWLTSSLICSSKWCYGKSRTVVWAVATSAIILYLPVVLENERSSLEEQQMLQQRQMLLGPNAAVGGAAGFMPGGMPQVTPGR